MAARAKALGEALRGENRPSWRSLAEELAKEGIVAPDGRPFAGATLKSNWFKVRQALAAAGEPVEFGERPKMRRKPGPKPGARRKVPTLPVQREAPVAASAAVPGPVQDEDEPRRKLRMVTMKGAAGGKESGSGE